MLGVSPEAYDEACTVLGPETTATVLACLLERSEHIHSAGGYLRDLTRRARNQTFTVSAMLSADRLAAEAADTAAGIGEGCGAVVTFAGVVRAQHKGRAVTHLVYEAFDALALRTFAQIQAEAAEWWPGVTLGIHHRTGRLAIGEASVVIAAASAHRAPAYEVCRYAIERIKQIVPIWKHEFFEGGDVWIEGATADPDDQSARETAMRRACA